MSVTSRRISAMRYINSLQQEIAEGGAPVMPPSAYDSMASLAAAMTPPDTALVTTINDAKAADDSYATGVAVDLVPVLDACMAVFNFTEEPPETP